MIAFNNIARGTAAFEDKDRRTLELLLRYQARHERAYQKARKDLEELETAVIARMTLPADVQVVTQPMAKRTGDKVWPVEETIALERRGWLPRPI
jgi:hypothetical protein